MSSDKDNKKSKSDASLHRPLRSSRIFSSALSLIEMPYTTPSRVERSLDAGSVDDNIVLPNSTLLEYVGEVRGSDRSSEPDIPSTFKSERRFTYTDAIRSDPLASTKMSNSFTNVADMRNVASAPIRTLHSDDFYPLGGSDDSDSPPGRKSSDIIKRLDKRSFESYESDDDRPLVGRKPSDIPTTLDKRSFESSEADDDRALVGRKSSDILTKFDTRPYESSDDGQALLRRNSSDIPTKFNERSFESSESDDDRSIVEDTASRTELPSYLEDDTLYKLKSTVPAALEETYDIKFILDDVRQKMRNSIEQAATSGSSTESIITISKPIPRDEESSSNPQYSDDSEVKSEEIRKRMFTYSVPKRTIPPGRSQQRKVQSQAYQTYNSSTSETAITNAKKAPPNSKHIIKGPDSFQSSKNMAKVSPNCKPTSGSDEVLSEMGLYQREVETWLKTVVEVVKGELETLYENKARHVKSKSDPESFLKKSSRKKKKSSKRKKFPYYPSGVIIPKCRPSNKQKKLIDAKSSSKPRFSDLFDSYYSSSMNDSTCEYYPEIEGEYDEIYQDQFLNDRQQDVPIPSNSYTTGDSYGDTDEDTSDAYYEKEYKGQGSEPNVPKARGSKELRKTYVNEWIENVPDLNNNITYNIDQGIHRINQNQLSNKVCSSIAGQNQSSRTLQKSKPRPVPAPFTISIDAATQMYEEALRDCKRDGEIFHQNLAEKFTKMHINGLRRIGIQKKLHDADIRRAVLMESKSTHLRNKSTKRMQKAFSQAKDQIESQTKINLMKMMEAKVLETKGVLKLFKDTMEAERRSVLEMKANEKIRTRKIYGEVNEQISKLESLLQHGTNDLDKISSKLRKTSSLDTIELLNSLHKKGYQQLQNEINRCITKLCSTFLLQK